MKMKVMSIAIAGAIGLAVSGANADEVWNPDYEQYIDSSFEQVTIQTTPGEGSSELVWSENYEEFVPANHPRHVARAEVVDESDELIYRAEYQEFVPKSLKQVTIGS